MSTPDADDIVLSELKREAKRRGHFALVLSREDLDLYLTLALWFVAGIMVAGPGRRT